MERDALSALAALLRELGIRWVLIGALAANRYRASPRLTQDVDLLLADAGPGVEALESAARAAGWDVRRASPEGDLLRLRHPDHGIADLLIAGTDYQHEAIRRAREEPIGNGVPTSALVWRVCACPQADSNSRQTFLESPRAMPTNFLEAKSFSACISTDFVRYSA